MITKKTKKPKARFTLRISGKSMERIFKKMLQDLNMSVLIKRCGKVAQITYPIISINIRENTITYQKGSEEETINIAKVVAIDIKSDNPTIVITKRGENSVS